MSDRPQDSDGKDRIAPESSEQDLADMISITRKRVDELLRRFKELDDADAAK